jgi:molybdate transport system substrate-binding protein
VTLPLVARAALAATFVLVLAGCSAVYTDESPTASTPEVSGELTVFAAASLQGAFTQIVEGAPADVFAAANESTMATVVDAGLAEAPQLFASNTLVIVVPAGNPADVSELADLADPDLSVVLCAPEVPCGSASQRLLAGADVSVAPASLEQNVTAVLTKVAAGEADAGLVYRTDVAGREDVESIVPDGAEAVVNLYPIAALRAAASPQAAAAFITYVSGLEGQRVLASFGFGAP